MKHQLEKSGFWAVPKRVALCKKITFAAKLIYGVLWTRKNADLEAFPTHEYIAKQLMMCLRYVRTGLKELERQKMITIYRRGLRKSNIYLLHVSVDKGDE